MDMQYCSSAVWIYLPSRTGANFPGIIASQLRELESACCIENLASAYGNNLLHLYNNIGDIYINHIPWNLSRNASGHNAPEI